MSGTRQYRSPEHAVQHIAAANHLNIPDYIAREIANAVLSYHDNIVSVQQQGPSDVWDQEEHYRDHIRHDMRWKLLDGITAKGLLPVALPTETVHFGRMEFGAEPTVLPDWAVERGDHGDTVVVRLSCKVRTPPIDREAAVKAGII